MSLTWELGGASHLASQSGSADQNVAYADLAAAVRLTVIACETLYDHAGKLNFAVEEDAVVRNEYAVEDNENFVAAVYLVANVDVVVLFNLAGVAGLTAVDQGDALGIGRYSEGDRVVLVASRMEMVGITRTS